MVSVSDPTKVKQYLDENNFSDVFMFLISSVDNLRNRGNLLLKNINDLDSGLKQILKKISENPEISPYDRECSQAFKDLHYLELEIIQRTSIFVELLAIYYNISRRDIRELPRAISAQDIDSSTLYQEFEFFKNQTIEEIQKNFRFSDTENFDELSAEEKHDLTCFFKEQSEIIKSYFSDIYHFNANFRPLYTKYKHIMSEFTGLYGIDIKSFNIQSHVYIRQKQIDKKNNVTYKVYVVPLSTDIVKYFDKIARSVWTLLYILLENHLMYFANQGKDFVPRTLLEASKFDKEKINKIIGKINGYCNPNFQAMLVINPNLDQNFQEEMKKALKENQMFVLNRDILDVEFRKTYGLSNANLLESSNKKVPEVETFELFSSSEIWNNYKISDGSLLKMREIPLKAIKLPFLDPNGKPTFNVYSQTLLAVFPPKSLLGTETPPCSQEELNKSIIEGNIKFEVLSEPWNEYSLESGIKIRIKVTLQNVSRTNRFGHYGEPIYVINKEVSLDVQ
jgi:hypothetical protein